MLYQKLGRRVAGGLAIITSLSADVFATSAKQFNLNADSIAEIVRDDINKRQALATADFTRNIYSEQATFQDEIDTYPLEKYIAGTKALFDADKSRVSIVGDVTATDAAINFRFQETLAFNIPFTPKVTLSGRVELTRDPVDGLIIKSREYWDQSPRDVLKTIKFK